MFVKLRALVVDDSRIMRHMIMETLRKTGLADFEFTEAEDGRDALAKFYEGDFHIGFIDWNMPFMNGMEFLRQTRQSATDADEEPVPMVMVSSEKTIGRIQEAMDVGGAEAFISKPFSVQELATKLERVVKKAIDVRLRKIRKENERSTAKSSSILKKIFS